MSKKADTSEDRLTTELEETVEQIMEQLQRNLPKPIYKATGHVTSRAQSYGLATLTERELQSIRALIAWAANEQDAAPETVQSITETHFHVDDVQKLQQKDYDEVIKFLVDLRIDELCN